MDENNRVNRQGSSEGVENYVNLVFSSGATIKITPIAKIKRGPSYSNKKKLR